MMLSTRNFIFSLALTGCMALTGTAHAQSALDDIAKSKTIRIAIPTDYPPYGFVGTDLAPQGLDIDMANLIAKKMGVKVELLPVTAANRIAYLQTHKADLVISSLGKNAEREAVINFSHAYAPFFQAVFAPAALPIKAWADLSGKTVGVTRGAMEDQELSKVAPSDVQIRRFEDHNATIAAFVAGQTQLVATSSAVADNMIKKNPQIKAEFKLLLKESPCFVGLAKGEDALLAKINDVIVEAKKSGELDALSVKWLGRASGDLPL